MAVRTEAAASRPRLPARDAACVQQAFDTTRLDAAGFHLVPGRRRGWPADAEAGNVWLTAEIGKPTPLRHHLLFAGLVVGLVATIGLFFTRNPMVM